MKGTPAIYLGRIVDKAHFRTNVYGPKGEKKLVESWDAFEALMQTGVWFATLKGAMESVTPVVLDEDESKGDATPKPKSKPKPKAKSRPKPVKVEDLEENVEVASELDDMVFEVTDNNK